EVVARWGRLMGMLATIATHPVIAFVVAGIALGVFSGIFRAKVTYREMLALAAHALLIPALGTVLRLIRRGAGVEFITSDPSWSLPLRALASIDPYIVWMLIVIVVAGHALSAKIPRAQAG